MKLVRALMPLLVLNVVACGSSDDGSSAGTRENTKTSGASEKFSPPAPAPGFQRFVAPVIPNVGPGTDVMVCQYVMAPLDHDVDVIQVQGYQSKYGHHIVAFATTVNAPVGTSRICNAQDNTEIGAFLGGIGGDAGAAVELPEGVAFRLTKGHSIMLNTHFLNPGKDTVNGESVLDVKFVDAAPNRVLASMFVNLKLDFEVEPQTRSTADAPCTIQKDLQLIMFSNHMHSLGATAITKVTRADGTIETVHEDPYWTNEMQFNVPFTRWDVNHPFVLKQGDSIQTHCEWNNPGTSVVHFPDEMCVGIGFYLSSTNEAPTCLSGHWFMR